MWGRRRISEHSASTGHLSPLASRSRRGNRGRRPGPEPSLYFLGWLSDCGGVVPSELESDELMLISRLTGSVSVFCLSGCSRATAPQAERRATEREPPPPRMDGGRAMGEPGRADKC